MTKKECPSCAMNVPSKSKECPICGYEFTDGRQKGLKLLAVLLALLFLYLAFRELFY
jgi:hypothetical protein